MSRSSNKGYQFTINATNGAVTAVYKIENGRTQYERIDSDEFYTYDAQTHTVTKTEWDDGRQEITIYTDVNQDGIFLKSGEGYAQSGGNAPVPGPIAQNGYQFERDANGSVTAVYKIENGRTKREGIDSDESYTYDAQTHTVTKTEWDDGRQEITIYTDANQDGIFLKSGEGYAQSGGNAPVPGPIAQNGYQFERDANGSVTAVYEVEHGQTQRETIDANETFIYDAASNTVTKTEIERGLTETVVYADADGDGTFQKISKTYTGTGGTVTWDTTHHNSDNDDQYNGLVYDSTDRDLAAEFQLELTGVTNVSAADFVL